MIRYGEGYIKSVVDFEAAASAKTFFRACCAWLQHGFDFHLLALYYVILYFILCGSCHGLKKGYVTLL